MNTPSSWAFVIVDPCCRHLLSMIFFVWHFFGVMLSFRKRWAMGMDLDRDTELGRKREHQQANALAGCHIAAWEAATAWSCWRLSFFGDCQGSVRKDLENIILYAYGRLRKDWHISEYTIYLNPLPLPEVCVVLFLCGQKAKILSNTTAHFPDHNVV